MFDLYHLSFCHFRTAKVPGVPLDTFHISYVCKLRIFEPQVQEHSPQGCLLWTWWHCNVSCHVMCNDGGGAATTETSVGNQLSLQRWSFSQTSPWLLILTPKLGQEQRNIGIEDGPEISWELSSKWWNGLKNGLKNVCKWWRLWPSGFFTGNIVECTGPTHPGKTAKWSRQSLWMLRCFELQYVLGTPLAANQQLAISTERNATSLHRIENQCASNKRFTEVGTFAAVMWSSLLLGRLFEPKARNNNHQFPILLDLLHPEYSWIQKKNAQIWFWYYQREKRKPTRTTLAAQLQHQHHQLCKFVIRLKIWSVGSLEPLNAELIKKFMRSPTTLGQCCF